MDKETTLITGASSGIGLELARQFAKNGHNIIITAPVQSELDVIAADFTREYGVQVYPIAMDITRESAANELYQAAQDRGLRVDILVNNAGRGFRGPFVDGPLADDIEMIRLNIEAVVRLTKRFLPDMVQRRSGRVLNTASIASFEPGPLLAIYHATKAFVLSFSEALATELKDSGITVTALCPGPVDTDFFPKADMVTSRAFQKANVMAPQEVAETGYAALMRGERVIVPGGVNKAMVFSRRMFPESAQAKKNEKIYEDVDPEDIKRVPGEIAAKHDD
jgi:short-subunit dehydrogenase